MRRFGQGRSKECREVGDNGQEVAMIQERRQNIPFPEVRSRYFGKMREKRRQNCLTFPNKLVL